MMRRIINIFTTLCLLLASQVGHAQLSELDITIVIRDQNSAPIPFQSFDLEVIGNVSGPLFTLTAFTDASGYFQDTLPVAPSQQGALLLSTTDCQGFTVNDTLSFNDSAFQWKNFDLTICNSGTGCQADFSANTNGLNVAFSNQSAVISSSQYQWDFGDGATSTQYSPTHAYATTGMYPVTLIQTDTVQNCADTMTQTVSVCSAKFITDTSGLTVDFQPLTTTYVSYNWDFGDGNTSTQVAPTHTYAQPGLYGVSLQITSAIGCTTTFFDSVAVGQVGAPCQANFTFDTLGQSVTFINTSQGSNLNYLWSFGDGGTSTAPSPSHTYLQGGTYNVCLLIFNTSGCSDTLCQTISVAPTGTNCSASFVAVPASNGLVHFQNTSIPQDSTLISSFSWDFGDGTIDSVGYNSNFHQYNSPGPFLACLTIETTMGCVATYCDSVYPAIGGNCQAEFSSTTNGLTANFTNLSTAGPNASYFWNFGDSTSGGTSTLANPSYTYGMPGTYLVTLTVTDSSSAGVCTDSYFDVVVITNNNQPCAADFTWNSLGGNTYQFTNLSNIGNQAFYGWDFGDGDTSSVVSPTHTYSGPGPWTVSLIAIDLSSGCFDTVSYQIGGSGSNTFSISGAVIADSTMPIFDGVVYLIEYDSLAGSLSAVDSTTILGSFYQFTGVAPGDYLVKAALQLNSPLYSNYLPTYLGDELFWFDAVGTVVTNGNVINPNINLIAGSNPGGPGFIGGSVAQGANKTTGDPVSDVSVLIFTANEEPVEHVKTNADGEFSFNNLPYGTYHLYVDMMNHYSERHVITLTPDEPSSEQAFFEVVGNDVVATSLANDLLADGIKVYPNPVSDRLQVEMTLTQPAQVSMRLINLMGQVLMQKPMGQRQGRLNSELTVESLPAGIYTLEVQTGEQATTQRIVIRR